MEQWIDKSFDICRGKRKGVQCPGSENQAHLWAFVLRSLPPAPPVLWGSCSLVEETGDCTTPSGSRAHVRVSVGLLG